MAWRLTIGGTDQTAAVDSFTTTVALNDRARATVVVGDLMPARYAELVSYAADGTTPLFGGVILQRRFQGRNPYDPTYQLTLEVGDWFTYADWVYSTKAYPVAVTLKQVLTDLVAEHLGQYGITLDPAQVVGPTIAAFTWTAKRVSDGLRELSDRTQYVVKIDPAKRLRMFVPATLAAPVAMTEAAPHCQELTWRDSDRTPYNKIVLSCGPAGAAEVTDERHAGDGARRTWPLNAPFVQMIGALAVASSGIHYPVGIYGVDDLPWTVELATNTMHQRADQPILAASDYWAMSYQALFPFTVTRATGATPIVEHAEARPDVLSIPVGEEIADSLLAQAQEAPREVVITTDTDGFIPGQALTIALATTRSIAGDFLITSVALTIVQDTTEGDRYWQYTIEAVESPLYQGSYLDAWRELAGVGGGSTTVSGGGPPGETGPPGPPGPQGPPGTVTGLPALGPGHLFVGNPSSVATDLPITGDIGFSAGGVTAIGAGVIVDADIAAAAGIVDTKLATLTTPGKVANSATTAAINVVPDTIVLRNANGDIGARVAYVDFIACAHGTAADIVVLDVNTLWVRPLGQFVVQPGANAWLEPAANLYLGPQGHFVLPNLPYTHNLGNLNAKYLSLHAAELWVESLVAQETIATIGGRVLVAPTTVLTRNLPATGNVVDDIYVKHNAFKLRVTGVETGSKIYLESNGKYEAMAVDSPTAPAPEADGSYKYSVIRNLDGSGQNEWFAGDAVLDTGKSDTTSGFIDLYAVSALRPGSGIGPAIVGNVRTGPGYADYAPRWAIGNLNGVYGYGGDTFGAAFGVPAAAWLKIDPVNGVRIGHGGTTVTHIDAAGNASFVGSIYAGAGRIGGWVLDPNYLVDPINNAGMISYTTGADDVRFWAGDTIANRATAPFRVHKSGLVVASNAQINGTVSALFGSIGGWILDPNYLRDNSDTAGMISLTSGGDEVRFYAGASVGGRGGAPFRVYQSGAVVMTSATITGGTVSANGAGITNINGANIQTGTVTATQIAARTISADRIGVGALTATEIAASTITGDRIAANTITADRLSVSTLSAITANLGTVNAGSITGVTITGTTITGGTISGTTITGVTISGSSITAGSGNTITLDNSGLNIAEGNGSGSARINLGGKNMWGASGRVVIGSDLEVQYALSAASGAITNGLVVGGPIQTNTVYQYSGSTRALYFRYGENQIAFWSGAAAGRENVTAIDPPADLLTVLDVPIVAYGPPAAREIGIVVEALAAVAPGAVYRDAGGAPDGIREDVWQVYTLWMLRALAARVAALEGA